MDGRLLIVKDEVDSISFNRDGDVIFDLIFSAFKRNEKVIVSFEDIYAVNTSFVNSAFIELLEFFSFEEIMKNLKFINSTKQINSTIIKRFKTEVAEKEKLQTT
ncbi:STAS-like domain-containing protein [Planococcus rifietoensis]|uniref:STAS-like domain-containing protein n=1 Tax=Planococcus rifietoensis TaxID=200991 RepID=UPI00384FEA01